MFAEDASVFLAEFGVPVVFGAVNTFGMLDMPGMLVLGDTISNDYTLTYAAGTLPGLGNKSAITVNSPLLGPAPTPFTVRDTMPHGDGVFWVAYLSKVQP